jgi:LuxR family maltose regulon positive regulatory protein
MKFLSSLSKITPPRFPHILHRTRLIEVLQQHRDKKLILVLGPAAQGKSTLAFSWINTCKTPSAWINLGAQDADPVSLFYLLVQALEQAQPYQDFSPLLTYPAVALGPREEIPLYRDWARSLYDLLAAPVQLVLDGLEQVPVESSFFRFLQVLLDEAPPGLHFILLSREMPPLNLQTFRIRQEAFIITGEELAFTLEETRDFLKVRRLSLPARSVKQIHRLTEGWAGGLVLLCERLERLPTADKEEFLTGDLTGKFKGDVFKYFGEQIFASLPPATQEFLIKSTILEVVNPDFIKDFLGVDKAREILDDLAGRNLFIQPIYDKKKGWLYRYHLLFRDFLRAKFQTRLGEEQQRAAYLQAGKLSEQRGQPQEAVNCYLRAQAYPQAIAVIRKVGLDLLKLGKNVELSQWLEALPPDLLRADPWLVFFRYMTRRFSGLPEDIFILLKARALFEQQQDERGAILSMAYLLEAAITRGHPAIPFLYELLDQAENLLRSSPSSQHLPEKAVLWFQMGFAYFFRGAAPRKGVTACQQAYLLAREMGDLPLQVGALAYAIGSLASLGEFARAEEMVQQGEKLLTRCPHAELQAIFFIQLSHYYFYKGDLENMGAVLRGARALTERHGLTYLYPAVRLYDLSLKAALGEFQEAEEIGSVMIHLTAAIGNRWVHGATLMLLGSTNYFKGDFLKAREFLVGAREVLSLPENRAEVQLSFIKIWLGLVAYHLQENGEAEKGLEEAVDHSRDLGSFLFQKEALMALALLKWQQGHIQEAAKYIQNALNLAQERGLDTPSHLSREDLLKVCLLALELGVEDAWNYVYHLLSSRLADLAGPELERLAKHPNPKVATQAAKIRLAIHRAGMPRLRIQTLGGFRVRRGESPLEEQAWEGNQPRLLLKALIAHGPLEMPKDVLIEDLWPDAAPEITEKNFKVTLHRLRKSLEPAVNKTFGSAYVHLKANLVSLDQELCQVDVNEFLRLYKIATHNDAQGHPKEALSFYHQALEFYGGDFLPEELYLPWAEAKREELRSIYLELLRRLARLQENRGSLTKAIDCYRKLLQADPFSDEPYQKLMLLYAHKGMRSAALKVYEDCRQALRQGLQMEPDEATTAIYRKILELPHAPKAKPGS